jgi:hypothetical protein
MDPKTEPSKLEHLVQRSKETLFQGISTLIMAAGIDYLGNLDIDNPYLSIAAAAGVLAACATDSQEQYRKEHHGESSEFDERCFYRAIAFAGIALGGRIMTQSSHALADYFTNVVKIAGSYGAGFILPYLIFSFKNKANEADDDEDDDDDDPEPEPKPDPATPRRIPQDYFSTN